tara:strand:- start:40474 stop:41109 length:636 start_codon:yes stop_codon:yes gene_type:complete
MLKIISRFKKYFLTSKEKKTETKNISDTVLKNNLEINEFLIVPTLIEHLKNNNHVLFDEFYTKYKVVEKKVIDSEILVSIAYEDKSVLKKFLEYKTSRSEFILYKDLKNFVCNCISLCNIESINFIIDYYNLLDNEEVSSDLFLESLITYKAAFEHNVKLEDFKMLNELYKNANKFKLNENIIFKKIIKKEEEFDIKLFNFIKMNEKIKDF